MRALPKKICVVDDDEAVCDSMRALLESHGINVEAYSSARDFLLNPNRDPSDCMLLDLDMPGMGGLQLLAAMREQGSSLPVIVLTGGGDVYTGGRAIQTGAHAFLCKPVDDHVLLQSIYSVMAEAHRENRAVAV